MYSQRPEIERIITNFKKALAKQGIKTDKIILFGYRAQGTASDNSDIDLVVISNNFEGLNFMQRCELLGRAIAEIMEPIEPLAYTHEEFNEQKHKASFLHEVFNETQTIKYSLTFLRRFYKYYGYNNSQILTIDLRFSGYFQNHHLLPAIGSNNSM